jgi:hypothetical protein
MDDVAAGCLDVLVLRFFSLVSGSELEEDSKRVGSNGEGDAVVDVAVVLITNVGASSGATRSGVVLRGATGMHGDAKCC